MKFIPKERYAISYPNRNTLILVDVDKFLNRLKKDDPDFYVGPDTKLLFSQGRIKNSMDYIEKFSEDPRSIHPKTGERWSYTMMFEPTETSISNGKLGIKNGRHRMVALKNLGYTHAYVEVPKDQTDLFKDLA